MVAIANAHNNKAAYLLMRVLKELCSSVKVILADGGYRGELIWNIKKKFGYVIQVVVSAYKEQGFRPILTCMHSFIPIPNHSNYSYEYIKNLYEKYRFNK